MALLAAVAGCGGTATPSPGAQPATPTALPVATATSLPTPTATAPPTAGPTPSPAASSAKRVTFKAGQVVDVQPGIFFADLTTGAIEGWQLPLHATGGDWANQIAMASISPDGRFILYPAAGALDNWCDWNVLDTRTGKTCALPEVRGWAGAFSPNGQTFLATTAHGIALLPSDCTGDTYPLGLPVDEEVAFARWSPDGKALLVVTQRNLPKGEAGLLVTTYLIALTLKEPTVVDRGQGRPVPPDWSPDGTLAVVAAPSGDNVQVVNRAGRTLWVTSLGVSSVRNRGWSPDGRSIILQADIYVRDGRSGIYAYILDAATGTTRFRVAEATAACDQTWTADGSHFLVWNNGNPGSPHYLIAADGSSLRQIDPDPRGYAAYLGLSPKEANRAVVHQWGPGPVSDSLKIIDLATGQLTPLVSAAPTATLGWDSQHPSRRWLSDGRLVFSTPHSGHGGCGRETASELRVEFPPFPEVQPVMPPGGK